MITKAAIHNRANMGQQQRKDVMVSESALVVSDSSPPPTTETHTPTVAEIELAALLRLKEPRQYNDLLPPLDEEEFELLHKVLIESPKLEHRSHLRLDFDNNFILELAQLQKHQTLPPSEAGAFCSPHLINHILAKERSFSAAKKKMQVGWEGRISSYVNAPGRSWGKDTDTVYAPMIWNNKHWVGLAINISLGIIELLDPNPDLYSKRKVDRMMSPLLNMFPYLVHKLCVSTTQSNSLKPYTWTRVPNLYNNKRSGDCGPVSAKFMEMHASGDPAPHMSGMKDILVDQLRKQYALDLYHDLVLPIYF
ncbi:unnamed protein product [Microthlaspi erraticum]|uniref:Ubiquitin-like protease family profile domain-containing protein n=1 Tax=Microthlaspi erraticum TaxID=1685480 RepID=A0A6D2JKI6_9BRAS|nr:unnamed protein product [Microthlaspi erraticum]CAA7044694.1 unnamed protein product [Microthlaspi erraticum]